MALCFDEAAAYAEWGLWVNVVLAIGTLVIAVFAVVQAVAAKRSATIAERALKLTQRADVLLETASIRFTQSQMLDGNSQVLLRFKNFGPTRANNLRFSILLQIPQIPEMQVPALPTSVLGASDSITISFDRFREFLTHQTFLDIANGVTPLTFNGTITYTDVFDLSHTTKCSGTYDPPSNMFRIKDESQAG